MDIEEIEEGAASVLREELGEQLGLLRDAMALVDATQTIACRGTAAEMPLARWVTIVMLVRIYNDARWVLLAAERGYPLQAGSLAAGIFEHAYTIAHIGKDEERAARWTDHASPRDAYEKTKRMVEEVIRRENKPAELIEQTIDLELTCYAQLCMPKHGNPILQRGRGVHAADGKVDIFAGPEVTEDANRIGWYALETAASRTLLALAHFFNAHLTGAADRPDAERLTDALRALAVRRDQSAAKARAKGWGEDPFEDQWVRGRGKDRSGGQ